MESKQRLLSMLRRMDGRGYKAYKSLKGTYDFENYHLLVDHVQGDPFATPSRMRVQISQKRAGFPEDTFNNKSREIALRDYLARMFSKAVKKHVKGKRGSGKSGQIFMDTPGQEILERTAVLISKDFVEARFVVGLSAFGRRIAARQTEEMLFSELPQLVKDSLLFSSLPRDGLYQHIETAEDADFMRSQLEPLGLVCFVADEAVLPRASGINPRPLTQGYVRQFRAPGSLRVRIKRPNAGDITGMGIPKGVTLIVGGGYHGKSTLLKAIETGIYNHIPGDGRECVVTDPDAVEIRAEDGRRVEKVDISPFISALPFGRETQSFSTEDASGSTSMAANTIEALEMGASVLLIDEDTSATNFMIRDHRMQELVSKDKEPITPFIDKIRQLYQDKEVSTVLVIGGSGDYFDVADCVICMIEYKPHDFTKQASLIADKYKAERKPEGGKTFGTIKRRIPDPKSFDPRKGKRPVKIMARGKSTIQFGIHHIDISSIEQLVDLSQVRAIGDAIHYACRYMDPKRTLQEVIQRVTNDIKEQGLDVLNPNPKGDYAEFRSLELAGAINRLRTLSVSQEGE
ncbi:MAG: ABC-ATPase domain-containing protein [Acidobacteriota bacterium]